VFGDAREALTAQLAVVGLPDTEARARDANFRIGGRDSGRRESLRKGSGSRIKIGVPRRLAVNNYSSRYCNCCVGWSTKDLSD
jgi:hypothetical protein